MKWINCKDAPPKIDSIVRRIGYTDTMTSGNFKDNIKKERINASDYQWLDESPDRLPNTADALIEGSLEQGVEDLHDQVRAHIRKDKLYDWSEAMTDNEMTYLENLLLTFNPLCPPGSIGYEEQARHIAKYRGANSSQHSGDAVVVLDWLLKQSDLDILIMNDGCFYYESDNDGDQPLKPEDIVKMYLKENPQSTPTPPDYIEVIEDHKRLVRELDEIINGKSGMAKQASLCDLVAQLKKEYRPTPPGIVDKLRESIPRFHELQAESTDVWNECCDTLATLLSEGEKGEKKENLKGEAKFDEKTGNATYPDKVHWGEMKKGWEGLDDNK